MKWFGLFDLLPMTICCILLYIGYYCLCVLSSVLFELMDRSMMCKSAALPNIVYAIENWISFKIEIPHIKETHSGLAEISYFLVFCLHVALPNQWLFSVYFVKGKKWLLFECIHIWLNKYVSHVCKGNKWFFPFTAHLPVRKKQCNKQYIPF